MQLAARAANACSRYALPNKKCLQCRQAYQFYFCMRCTAACLLTYAEAHNCKATFCKETLACAKAHISEGPS